MYSYIPVNIMSNANENNTVSVAKPILTSFMIDGDNFWWHGLYYGENTNLLHGLYQEIFSIKRKDQR